MNSKDIIGKMGLLKENREEFFSNSRIIFSMFPEKQWKVLETEHSIVIVEPELKIRRVIFATNNFDDLKRLLQSIGTNIVIEVVSKDEAYMYNEIKGLGMEKICTQLRVSCKDISLTFSRDSNMLRYYDESMLNYATVMDVDKINEILWETFDTRSSHLKEKTELIEQIKHREFAIHKNNYDKIDMIIQHYVTPKSFYFNHVINKGEKALFHALTLNLLKKYNDNGGKYAYAWVNEGNIASFRFFEKYNLVEDGLYNSIYYV